MIDGHRQLREIFAKFWQSKDHKEIPPISLVPKEDPTTLFTGSGMQQLVPNLLGEKHPLGTRLYNIQPCFRAQDIEEVGNNRHDTFFEMMGNWSLGDYFKEEQLEWYFNFLTKEMGLSLEKLHITVFEGEGSLPADEESYSVWKKLGVPESKIYKYGSSKNWWSRSGTPKNMPAGEPGGPDSEVFYEFDVEHDKNYGAECHPNCDCGKFTEIGNSVFMQYQKQSDGSFSELPKKNVDFGGGLERMLTALNNDPDNFKTDVFSHIIAEVENVSGKKYSDKSNQASLRVISDHIKAATFLIINSVTPSNKEQGYVLRRLIRRSAIKMYQLNGELSPDFESVIDAILSTYDGIADVDKSAHRQTAPQIINDEINKFANSLDRGLKVVNKLKSVDGKIAFDLYQSYGFPLEITEELFKEKGQEIDKKQFYNEFEKHKNVSRKGADKKFKGGLADTQEQTIKYHTATHLLHQALFDVYGDDIRQEGSNITTDRLRFDFSTSKKPSKEDMSKLEKIINDRVNDRLAVRFEIMNRDEAFKIGARAFFKEKYPDKVKVYYIGGSTDSTSSLQASSPRSSYSIEFCGGPHLKNTEEIGTIKIFKFEKIGNNLYRIYAK